MSKIQCKKKKKKKKKKEGEKNCANLRTQLSRRDPSTIEMSDVQETSLKGQWKITRRL